MTGWTLLLDYLLKQANISPQQITGYDREELTHTAVAAQIAAATGVGRATMLVMPRPQAGRSPSSSGRSWRGVRPAAGDQFAGAVSGAAGSVKGLGWRRGAGSFSVVP